MSAEAWGLPGAIVFGAILLAIAFAERPKRRVIAGVRRDPSLPILGASDLWRGVIRALEPDLAAEGVVAQLAGTHTVLVAGSVRLPTRTAGRLLRVPNDDPRMLAEVGRAHAGERLVVVIRPAPDEVDEWRGAVAGLPAGVPCLVVVPMGEGSPELVEEAGAWRILA